MAVRGGDEYLGSIWAVVSGPPSMQFKASMIEAARIIALRMLTNRELATDASRLRTRNVDALIQGGASARKALVQLGLPNSATCVLAVALRRDDAGSPDAEEALARVHAALNMHVGTIHPRAAAALVGRTIYVVLPLLGEEDHAALRARAAAEDIVERIGARIPVVVGVGDVVADVAQLNRSRAGADTAVRVLASVTRRSHVGSVATAADVQVEALLIRMADAIASEGGTLVGPLATLVAYDDQHKTDLVATMNAWLDAFGDLATVASSMHVHPNTLRYRLRRVSEVTQMDLSDPEVRLGIMLQLRLFPLRSVVRGDDPPDADQ
jgi:sugar diacid utilization regulator